MDLSGSKIGGSVEGKVLILPDPMGATGSTTIRAVDHYLEHHGRPSHVLALPMIATPEYLRAVTDRVENVSVYTLRVDRGLSPPDVLATPPGTHWERERGAQRERVHRARRGRDGRGAEQLVVLSGLRPPVAQLPLRDLARARSR